MCWRKLFKGSIWDSELCKSGKGSIKLLTDSFLGDLVLVHHRDAARSSDWFPRSFARSHSFVFSAENWTEKMKMWWKISLNSETKNSASTLRGVDRAPRSKARARMHPLYNDKETRFVDREKERLPKRRKCPQGRSLLVQIQCTASEHAVCNASV